jgi:hypothetical protein
MVGEGLPADGRLLKPGESHKLEPKKGTTVYTDKLFPSVKVWVVVDDGVIADARAAHDGSLKIPDMAPAEYALKAYFEGALKTSVPTFKVPTTGSVDLKEPIQVGPASASASASAGGK